ncbi:hypothetical protein EDC01DRAFT_644131 [Geopyxis carbonaria]|nr:hypothetical protein EDC01DRAFT_644131 [Geopyxis carbonaria]
MPPPPCLCLYACLPPLTSLEIAQYIVECSWRRGRIRASVLVLFAVRVRQSAGRTRAVLPARRGPDTPWPDVTPI